MVNWLLPEREYTIAVRGYYQLLGPAGTITVRLEGNIDNCMTDSGTRHNCMQLHIIYVVP